MNSFDFYQKQSATTAIYPHDSFNLVLAYLTLGLNGEAGEVAEKVKKMIRDGRDIEDVRPEIAKELGDVLWYATQLCTELDLRLDAVAEGNLDKLKLRQENGTLSGSGDTR